MRRLAFALSFALFCPLAAAAGPTDDSRALFEATQAAATAFLGAIDIMGDTPAAARTTLDASVKRPASVAEKTWYEKFHSAEDTGGYLQHMSCRTAAMTLQEISTDLIDFLDGKRDRPDVSGDADWFRESYSQCEVSLGMEPTFPIDDAPDDDED